MTSRLILLLAALLLPVIAHAQDATSSAADTTVSRADALRAMRQEKAQMLEPNDPPGRLERLLGRLERKLSGGGGAGAGFMGVRPVLGGLRQGAGLAGGLAFEPFGRRGRTLFSAEAAASLKKYWGVRGLAGYRGGPVVVAAYGQFRHMPQERFFGIGSDSRLAQESTYRLNEADIGVLAGLQASSRFGFGVQGGYVTADPGPGKNSDVPTTQEAFERLPALGITTEHVAGGGWIQFDGRDPAPVRRFFQDISPLEPGIIRMPLETRRGFFALVEFTNNISFDDRRFGFQRLNVQSQQYIPFRHGHHVFAFREFASFTRTDGTQVPFHMLPALGGAYTLRGYKLFRFRDRHAVLLNAEYRWNIWRLADLVLFVDAGQVFPEAAKIAFDNLKSSYGGGLRLLARERGFLRFEVGRSEEGTEVILLLTGQF